MEGASLDLRLSEVAGEPVRRPFTHHATPSPTGVAGSDDPFT
jgi:hypothetical protein